MINKEAILAFLSKNKKAYFNDFELVKIGLFGSFASDMQNNESDIDILLESLDQIPKTYQRKNQESKR